MSKLMDIAKVWVDMIYPRVKTGPHSAQRTKIRTAYLLGFERGYRIATRARLNSIKYMTGEQDNDN